MPFTITKKNGTVLTKEVDSNNKCYIQKLKKIGWKENKPSSKKAKSND